MRQYGFSAQLLEEFSWRVEALLADETVLA